MAAAYLLSADALAAIRTAVEQQLRETLNTAGRGFVEDTVSDASDCLMAFTPADGIPAMIPGTEFVPGTGSAEGEYNTPGFADCDAYQVLIGANPDWVALKTPELRQLGAPLVLRVYNMTEDPVPGGSWVLTVKDRGGRWWAAPNRKGTIVSVSTTGYIVPYYASGWTFNVSAAAGNIVFNLSNPGIAVPMDITVVKTDATTNTVTLTGQIGETVQGTSVLLFQGQTVRVKWLGNGLWDAASATFGPVSRGVPHQLLVGGLPSQSPNYTPTWISYTFQAQSGSFTTAGDDDYVQYTVSGSNVTATVTTTGPRVYSFVWTGSGSFTVSGGTADGVVVSTPCTVFVLPLGYWIYPIPKVDGGTF